MKIYQRPCETDMLVAGNFNDKLYAPEGNCGKEEIAVAMEIIGLESTTMHFLPLCNAWDQDGRMWCMLWKGMEVRYRTDYHLATDHHLIQNISIWNPRKSSDHYMLLGCLHDAVHWEHSCYLGQRRCPPLHPPQTQTREEQWFADLSKSITKTPPC